LKDDVVDPRFACVACVPMPGEGDLVIDEASVHTIDDSSAGETNDTGFIMFRCT